MGDDVLYDPTVIQPVDRLGTPVTHPFADMVKITGQRNYVSWGWTDADLYRAIEADPENRDEYLEELAQRRIDASTDHELANRFEDEIKARIAAISLEDPQHPGDDGA